MSETCLTAIPEYIQEQYNQLNYSSKKVFEFLLTGQKFSVVQLTDLTHVPDVRSAIRYIRDAGIPVADYWEYTEFSRYKVYFIHDPLQNIGK